MPIDPKIEAPLRKMLGHAMRGELDDLYALILAAGDQVSEAAVVLAIKASGYISVHVSERWPRDVDVRELAKRAVKTTAGREVTEDEISTYLSRVVLGNESVLEAFPGDKKAGIIPLFTTAALLASFGPKGLTQWEYLDSIWNALDTAEAADDSVAPAMVYLYGKAK
jgi:hypothetical protein